MKRTGEARSTFVLAAVSWLIAASPGLARAADALPEFSNYGALQVVDTDGDVVPMPLKHTAVDAKVSGFLAAVQVEQRFHNPFDRPIEAIYTFPLPQRAAVYAMQMTVGQRTIIGAVKKRADARKAYERAKRQGRTAALLDQQRPNIFTQRVANILPGEEIVVTLKYAQDLDYEHGRYEFVFPMVVGPRYLGGGTPDPGAISPPLLRKGVRPGHDIDVTLHIDAGMPIRALSVPTHKVSRTWDPGQRVTIALADGDTIPNRDFVVRYEIDGERPEAAILAHKDERGGHFLMMVQPEADVDEAAIAPREYVFVVDTSGSMRGKPIEQVQRVVSRCLGGMRASDSFQVIAFAGSARRLFRKSVPATRQNIAAAGQLIQRMRGGGGTELLPALDLALNAPEDPQRSRVVLFLTDGYIGYEDRVLSYIRDHVGEANVFAMGIGSSVNRFLIDGMGRLGMGRPFYLLNHEAPDPIVDRFYRYVSKPTLTAIDVDFGDLDVEELTPSRLPDLFAERPLFLMGRYDKGGKGVVKLKGQLAGRPWSEDLDVYLPETVTARSGDRAATDPLVDNEAIGLLWARHRIADYMDFWRTDPERKGEFEEAVTKLALDYQLMSRFTSFVAVDSAIRNEDGDPVAVPVAVPLPEGVEESAASAHRYARVSTIRGLGGLGASGFGRGGGGRKLGRAGGLSSSPLVGGLPGGGKAFKVRSATPRALKAAPSPRMSLADVAGDGAADKTILRRRSRALRVCLAKAPTTSARLEVRLEIGKHGRVVAVKFVKGAEEIPALAECIKARLKLWRFPRSPKKRTLKFRLQLAGKE